MSTVRNKGQLRGFSSFLLGIWHPVHSWAAALLNVCSSPSLSFCFTLSFCVCAHVCVIHIYIYVYILYIHICISVIYRKSNCTKVCIHLCQFTHLPESIKKNCKLSPKCTNYILRVHNQVMKAIHGLQESDSCININNS